MQKLALAALWAVAAASANAAAPDPNMTCTAYMTQTASVGPTPKTGDIQTDKMTADLDKKIHEYCSAHPSATAMEAAIDAMGG